MRPGSRHLPRRTGRWRRWVGRPSTRLLCIAALAAFTAVIATPADGDTTGPAAHLAGAAGLLRSSRTARSFSGVPAVGALFTSSDGKLGSHFCTASVVHSPHGDLLITAAHCVTGVRGDIVFAPGYTGGTALYGLWPVTRTFTDQTWQSTSDPDDDIAFLRVGAGGAGVPIEDVTGAERLGVGTPARELTRVIGYPDAADQPVVCRNWTRPFGATEMEFDCGDFTDGTSGGPFLVHVNRATGEGTVVGVIGGYQQGGDTPARSYSIMFGQRVSALYRAAVAAG